MKVVATHSHKKAREIIERKYAGEYQQIVSAIEAVDAHALEKKYSNEKTMQGKALFSPPAINKALKDILYPQGWAKYNPGKRQSDYQEFSYKFSHKVRETGVSHARTLNLDGLNNKVGLEIQLGKYAFVPFDMFVKLPIFFKQGIVEVGVEIVPMHAMIYQVGEDGGKGRAMSSGIGPYEQFYAEMMERGEADIDCPILLVGIDAPVSVPTTEAERDDDGKPMLTLELN